MKQKQHDGKGQSYTALPQPKSTVNHAQTGHDGGRTTKKAGTNRSTPPVIHKGSIGGGDGGYCKSQGQKSNTGCNGGY